MNKTQLLAIKNLEKALLETAKAKIILYGVDDKIIAFDKREHDEARRLHPYGHEALEYLDWGITIKDGGAYTDSCAS